MPRSLCPNGITLDTVYELQVSDKYPRQIKLESLLADHQYCSSYI